MMKVLVNQPENVMPSQEDQKMFRDFGDDENNPTHQTMMRTYSNMHTHQTVQFVQDKMKDWLQFNKFEATIMEALDKLNSVVDEADPDLDLPNIVHAFQTAERIREKYPDDDWFQLTGLIHDLGKVMAWYGEPHWCVCGDTYPIGCLPRKSIIYADWSFKDNADLQDPRYNTKLGIYHEGIGLENVLMSWGHDEYMYRALLHNNTTLPEEGLYIVRFHSFYPWHLKEDYMDLCNEKDIKMLEWITRFRDFDLYTKSKTLPDIEALKPYYQAIIDKYIPGKLKF